MTRRRSRVLDECCICLSKIRSSKDDYYRCSNCKHYMHEVCLSQTFSLICPLCRVEMVGLREEVKERIEENYLEMTSRIPYRFIRTHFPTFISNFILGLLESLRELPEADSMYYSTYTL